MTHGTTSEDSPIARYLDRTGEGIQQVAYGVDAKDAGGVLVELVEAAPTTPAVRSR